MPRLVAAALAGAAMIVAGCSSGQGLDDDLMVVDTPVAATPARSPAQHAEPAGRVLPLAGEVTAMTVDDRTRTLAVAVAEPAGLLLYDLTDLAATPRRVALPAPVEDLTLAGQGGPLLAAAKSKLVRITLPGGELELADVDGRPVSAAQLAEHTLVAMRDRKAVAVVDGDQVRKVIAEDMFSADRVRSTGDGAVVLDRLRNAVLELDVPSGTVSHAIRAGDGSTNAVTDRFGRVLVADTRGGALLAFSLDPLLLRQRYPVPGAPYGLAYDPSSDVLWVTLTKTNEVVGLHVAGGEPRELHRFPTVTQPNTVAVDPTGGRVIVASANGGGIQVMSNEH